MANKILVSLPEKFLEDVDRVATEEHRSRSELIREALRAYLEVKKGKVGEQFAESKAWELASDEALENFEEGLNN